VRKRPFKLRFSHVLVGALAFFGFFCSLAAANTDRVVVVWQDLHYPPIGFTTGPLVGEGFMQKTRNWLIEQLPQFDHETTEIIIGRFVEQARHGEILCSTFLIQTKARKNFLTYSSPLYAMRPVSLLVAKDRLDDVFAATIDGHVDLSVIARLNRLSVGIPLDYRFAEEFGQQLADLRAAPLTAQAGELPLLVRMFDAGRIDALLAYEANLIYHQKQGQLNRAMVSFPLLHTKLQPVSVSCTKSDAGDQLINAVNQILSDDENRRETARFYSQWISQSRRAEFMNALSD